MKKQQKKPKNSTSQECTIQSSFSSHPPSRNTFFDEARELFEGYVPAIGGLTFGQNILKDELLQYESKLHLRTIPNMGIRVSFPGYDGAQQPALGVAFCSEGMEQALRNYEESLAIVTDLPAFLEAYPQGGKDPRLQKVCLGGFINLGKSLHLRNLIFPTSLLTSWILCGPLFHTLWKCRSFDILFHSAYQDLIKHLLQQITPCWKENLLWFANREERVNRLREEAKSFRIHSSSFLSISQKNEVFQERFREWLKNMGELHHIPLFHNLGWDNKNRRWDDSKRERTDPNLLLDILEKEKPAFGLETHWFTSPIQSIYASRVSPRFVLSRCNIPLHHMVTDPVNLHIACLSDAFADLFTMTSFSFNYSPTHGASNFPCFGNRAFPVLFPGDPHKNFRGKLHESKPSALSPLAGQHTPSGFFMATNFRKEVIPATPETTRRIIFFLATELRKKIHGNSIRYNTFFLVLIEAVDSMTSMALKNFTTIPFQSFADRTLGFGTAINILHSITKLLVAMDAMDIAEELQVPFHIYSTGEWRGGNSSIWRGYIPKSEVDALGKSGWVRISPQPQLAGEPFHDMADAFTHGHLCIGMNGHEKEYAPDLFQRIEPCTYSTFNTLRLRMTEALSEPQVFFETMQKMQEAPEKPQASFLGHGKTSNICDHLRHFPWEIPPLGGPANVLSVLSSLPSAGDLQRKMEALEPLLTDSKGVQTYMEGLPEKEGTHAAFIASYLDIS